MRCAFKKTLKTTHFSYYIMTQSAALSLFNQANNGNELLAILDSLIQDNDDAQGEEVSPFA